ncbi:hypothetical protein [Bradyrhizobium sp. SYSU BS000235]|uniref:hypothetical protein n=1 Tax=Bradyrhizobium sp. SYSU BS000235 TaxID=3411332 RepID=UPI003C73A2BD
MTTKSKRKSNKDARRTMKKRTLTAASRASDRDARKTMRKDSLDKFTKKITPVTLDAPAETVSHGTPPASAENGLANASELNENALTERAKLQESMIVQDFAHEWFEFFGERSRQQMLLMKAIQDCRSLPDLQQAYSEFWQNAFTQYIEEPRRILRITQEAVSGASHGATKATLH